MKIKLLFFLIICAFIFNSCISKYTYQIEKDLPTQNFQYLDIVSVKVKKWSFVLFEGNNFVLQAKKDLQLICPLRENEDVINMLSEHKSTLVLGLLRKHDVTLTVDKIVYVSDSSVSKYSEKYLEKIKVETDTINRDLFKFGDTVIYKATSFGKGGFNEQSKCVFISYNKEIGKAMLSIANGKGINQVKNVNINEVFTYKIKNYKNFEINEVIDLKTVNEDYSDITVCAFSINYILIVEKGMLIKVKYKKIQKK